MTRLLVALGLMGALMPAFGNRTLAASGVEAGVGDGAVWEGDAGMRTLDFPVTLSQAASGTVTVTATIAAATATQNADFKVAYGNVKTITFKPGQTYKVVATTVLPDTAAEGNESYTITLSNPTGGATLGRAIGTGTILDDDPGGGTRLAIGDASTVEGDSGSHKLKFWATLSSPATTTISATATASGGTATLGGDFKAMAAKTLTFKPGQVKQPVIVTVLSDPVPEADETMMVMLTNASGATLADDMGNGTILDDDASGVVQTATFRLGPFNLNPQGSAGDRNQASQSNIPRVSGAFGVVGMNFDVVHGDGTPEPRENVHLHHVVFMDASRPDTLCPSLPNRFAGSGAERTPAYFGPEYAYKAGTTDQWSALWDVMNMSTASHSVYIQYTIDYVTGNDLANAKPLTSYFYDVDNCWGDSAYDAPGNGGPGSVYTKSISYTAPRSGVRVFTGGHLHDGGIDLSFKQGGTEICKPTATYMNGMLESISYCNTPVNVTAGQSLSLTARYDNSIPRTGVMGISLSYVWEP